ncbi:hypothetical protein BWI75_09775 [Gloeocapsopsis sp. AAB1 = 1H9]|uniref:Uncharacterized protein n=1 Tax=Gloeocapsopsis dulcis AAB1 = 1H9 TaxID=1433147 RepID=A0A6N8FU39_9CHRO|nr:hypothetical protein [Gloeocapsopsis dulcis AAB1 = 1H9]
MRQRKNHCLMILALPLDSRSRKVRRISLARKPTLKNVGLDIDSQIYFLLMTKTVGFNLLD